MEKYPWIDEYLMSKLGATKDYKQEWGWHRYMVGSKMFAGLTRPSDKYDPMYAGKDLVSLKCEPLMAEILRSQHPQVLPGFYMDKRNWNSIDLAGGLPAEAIKQMIDESYNLVFSKLTNKLQKEIIGTI